MSFWPVHCYLDQAELEGLDPEQALAAVNCANGLIRDGLTPILSLKHLAKLTELPYFALSRFVELPERSYYQFVVPKSSGGSRNIFIPNTLLLRVQRFLVRNVLNVLKPHPQSQAYSPGCSPLACASLHCRADWVIKWDIVSFFSSISAISVCNIFRNAGYPPLLCFELSQLCTNPLASIGKPVTVKTGTPYPCRRLGFLPQGAPTSPMLSNLAAKSLDEQLAKLAGDRFVFTRYADDITFSARKGAFSRRDVPNLKRDVDAAIRAEGFLPNNRKFRIFPPGARKIVLGLLVDRERPRLARKFKNKLEKHAYFLQKFGPFQHAEKAGFLSVFQLRHHVEGLLNYARSIEPVFASRIEKTIENVDWPL